MKKVKKKWVLIWFKVYIDKVLSYVYMFFLNSYGIKVIGFIVVEVNNNVCIVGVVYVFIIIGNKCLVFFNIKFEWIWNCELL